MRILTTTQEKILQEERAALQDLRLALAQFEATAEDQDALRQSLEQLDDFFLLVVAGEFNAGKSALINALLGERALKEGVTPTTTQINILRHGAEATRQVLSEHLHELTAPATLLQEMSIVDTPGTNAIIREHEEITRQFLPRADLVVFITSADRPFTESERAFVAGIREWGKKVVVVINKIDMLDSAADLDQIRTFVDENARKLLGFTPEIFPVSARQALRAKQSEAELWESSGFGALEDYIRDTLDEAGRLRLKFLNPLGVGARLLGRYQDIASDRLNLLTEDRKKIDDIDRQLELYQGDLSRDFNFRLSDIEKILYEMESRGEEYFEETFRLGRVFDLIKKEKIQQEFTQRVIGDVPQRIEQRVTELVDWLVESDLGQWQAVTAHLADRRREHRERIVGDMQVGSFHYDRQRLIEGLGRETQRVVDSYDRTAEAGRIAEGAQTAVAAAAALEVGAIGLGALITAIATTAAMDVTGVLLAGVVAALGLFMIPARKRKAINEMHQRVGEMRQQLVQALTAQFEREFARSAQKIREAIAPYTRFVRAEQSRLEEAHSGFEALKERLGRVRAQVDEMD